jgi:biotin transporter BioY
MEFLLLFWVFWPILAGVIADKKNRSVIGWVIAAALFGLFACIILGVMEKIPKHKNKSA